MSRTFTSVVDDEILNGMSSLLWALAWAAHCEETGCTSLSGAEITAIMPPIPQAATDEAYALASRLVDKFGMTLAEMYAKACAADDAANAEEPRSLPYCAHESAARFGECLVYEAYGHGVSWSDNHATAALPSHFHVYDDGDLQALAEEQCGCMQFDVQVVSKDEWTDSDGNCHSEPGPGREQSVALDVWTPDYYRARAWADRHQAIDGSSWETAQDLDGLVYAYTYDRPGLIADLIAEGYSLDLSEYDPDEEECPRT